MNIYYHIGLHKTATTTLQEVYFNKCFELNLLTTQTQAFKKYYRMIAYQDPIYFSAAAAHDAIRPLLRDDIPNLISNEGFSGPLHAAVAEYGLDHRKSILENIQAVHPDCRIIITIRRQDSWARSLYRQYLKVGGTKSAARFFGFSRSPNQPLFAPDRFLFQPYIDRLQAMFPAGVLVLVFEDLLKNPQDYLCTLTDFLGIQALDTPQTKRNATRLGPKGMFVSRLINHLFRSHLNPGGILPGFPRITEGRVEFISPSMLLHEHWPGRVPVAPGDALGRIASEILTMAADKNRCLDERYGLGLARHHYY